MEKGQDPAVIGCQDCGVPDRIAAWWPEAWRTMAIRLGSLKDKLDSTNDAAET